MIEELFVYIYSYEKWKSFLLPVLINDQQSVYWSGAMGFEKGRRLCAYK